MSPIETHQNEQLDVKAAWLWCGLGWYRSPIVNCSTFKPTMPEVQNRR